MSGMHTAACDEISEAVGKELVRVALKADAVFLAQYLALYADQANTMTSSVDDDCPPLSSPAIMAIINHTEGRVD
jgi:hypothetical protein